MKTNRNHNRLKILMVVADLPSKKDPSFQPFVKSQIQSIIELGHEVQICNIKGPDAWHHYFTTAPDLFRQARSFKPDVVHSHFSYCAFTALSTLPFPQVVSFMGDDLLGDFKENGRKTVRSYVHKPIAWLVILATSQVIVKNKEMAEYVRHPYVNVIPNGVDFKVFYPIDKETARQKLNLNTDRRYIIFPGDIKDETKRFSLANAACKILRSRYKLDHDLLIMRTKPQNELNFYFNAADAMVFTSWSEGSPNVIKEAMACNTPLVSVFVGDVEDVIANTKNCFVVQDNPEIIARHLYQVLESGERSNGRDTVGHLALRKVARRVERVYYKAIQFA